MDIVMDNIEIKQEIMDDMKIDLTQVQFEFARPTVQNEVKPSVQALSTALSRRNDNNQAKPQKQQDRPIIARKVGTITVNYRRNAHRHFQRLAQNVPAEPPRPTVTLAPTASTTTIFMPAIKLNSTDTNSNEQDADSNRVESGSKEMEDEMLFIEPEIKIEINEYDGVSMDQGSAAQQPPNDIAQAPNANQFYCEACQYVYSKNSIYQHKKTAKHQNNLMAMNNNG